MPLLQRMHSIGAAAIALVAASIAALAAPAAGMPAATPSSTAWTMPVVAGMQPDLVTAPDASLLMSWVEGSAAAKRLRLARWAGGRWQPATTIASGALFGNAVDTPHVRQTPDGAVWAVWLKAGRGGGESSDVVLARSADGGRTWSAPAPVNVDGTPSEHGFVSTWVAARDRLGVAWLDGRAKSGDDSGAQMLRAATFDHALHRLAERAVDLRVCDCCHTDIAMTSRGALLVYRDRSPDEVRDIRVARLQGGRWSTPRAVHADGWVMPGCPVNGPAVSADGSDAAVAWYTAAGGTPEVRLATSRDAGERFAAPVVLDRGGAVLGRMDAAVHRGRVAVVWLREDAQGQSLWLATASTSQPSAVRRQRLAMLAGRGRGTGMPRLATDGDALRVVWTDVVEGHPVLRGRRVPAG